MQSIEPGASLQVVPAEVLLDIISYLPYHPSTPLNLQLVSRQWRGLVKSHEHGLVRANVQNEFPWATAEYPGLFDQAGKHTYATLRTMYGRVSTLANIKARCKVVRERGDNHSAWTTDRAIKTHHAGLLLLYRLQDAGSPDDCRALIQSLPISSLAVLLFSLLMSVHLLRVIGPDMVVYHPAINTEEQRSEIGLACEEVILRDGPDFLLGLLQSKTASVSTLQQEYNAMESRQQPHEDGTPRSPTLIATVRQTFSKGVGCQIQHNMLFMWDVLDNECLPLAFDETGSKTIEKIVGGAALPKQHSGCCMFALR